MPPALEKQFEFARDAIKHDDTLTNYRTTWMLVFQGFLFSAYANGGGFGSKSSIPMESISGHERGLTVICVLGIVSAIVTAVGVLASDRQLRVTRTWWRERMREAIEKSTPEDSVKQEMFPPQYEDKTPARIYSPPGLFILLGIAWGILAWLV